MHVFYIDRDPYTQVLYRALRRKGGDVMPATFTHALRILNAESCDAAIVDPAARYEWETCDPYQVIKLILDSEWSRTHELVVYSQIVHEEVMRRVMSAGVRPEQVRYYSKAKREVPPLLECIREEILESPGLVGGDVGPLRIDITVEWIRQNHLLYSYLCEFVMNKVVRHRTGMSRRQAINQLPIGLQKIWHVNVLISEILNGGLSQFFSNSLRGDATGRAICDARNAVVGLGLSKLSGIVDEAIGRIKTCLPPGVIDRVEPDNSSTTEDDHLAIALELDDLDRRFGELDDSWEDEVESYVKSHPEEFATA